MSTQFPDLGEGWNLDDWTIDYKDMRELARHMEELARYARVKATAMKRRLEGKVSHAMQLERHLEQIYRDLPENWKW